MRVYDRNIIFVLIAGLVFLMLPNQALAAGGSWVPCWSDELGIAPDKEPQMGQIVDTVMATVVDADKLTALKFKKVEEGARVRMVNLGSTWWSVTVGEKVYFPALWNVKLLSTGQSQVLVPKKKKPYGPARPVVEQKTVSVPGNQDWSATGLTLQPQDRVTVTATGTVQFNTTYNDAHTGPEGWSRATYQADWPSDFYQCDDPYQGFNHAAMIGGVGEDVFLVGSKHSFWGKSGPMYLGINDCSLTGACANTGQFKAVVKVEREIVPKP
jgi:hypothetical protein